MEGCEPAPIFPAEVIDVERAFVEHGSAHLKARWRPLRHVNLCPWRISAIAAIALVLSRLENPY